MFFACFCQMIPLCRGTAGSAEHASMCRGDARAVMAASPRKQHHASKEAGGQEVLAVDHPCLTNPPAGLALTTGNAIRSRMWAPAPQWRPRQTLSPFLCCGARRSPRCSCAGPAEPAWRQEGGSIPQCALAQKVLFCSLLFFPVWRAPPCLWPPPAPKGGLHMIARRQPSRMLTGVVPDTPESDEQAEREISLPLSARPDLVPTSPSRHLLFPENSRGLPPSDTQARGLGAAAPSLHALSRRKRVGDFGAALVGPLRCLAMAASSKPSSSNFFVSVCSASLSLSLLFFVRACRCTSLALHSSFTQP